MTALSFSNLPMSFCSLGVQVSTQMANSATSSKTCAFSLGFGPYWGWYLRDLGGSQDICQVDES